MKRPHAFRNALLILTLLTAAVTRAEDSAKKVDVCVYGATPAGILAAVAARQERCSVLVKGGVETGEWASREEWNEAKPGWEWLFPFIDKNKDGKISTAEHTDFQEYKKQYPDWQKRVRAELPGQAGGKR